MNENTIATIVASAVAQALAAAGVTEETTIKAPKAGKAKATTKAKARPAVTGGPSFPEARAALVALKAEGKAPKGMTVKEAIAEGLLPALGTTAPAKGKGKGKAKASKKAKAPVGPSFTDLRAMLVAHKAAGLIPAGVSVRVAQDTGLMDANGEFIGEAPVLEAPKAKKAGKKAKASKKAKAPEAQAEAVVAEVEADAPAKLRASEGPRRANGTIAPKAEWADREALAMTGVFDRHEIDRAVDAMREAGKYNA